MIIGILKSFSSVNNKSPDPTNTALLSVYASVPANCPRDKESRLLKENNLIGALAHDPLPSREGKQKGADVVMPV
jgi:hypothetical protein